MSENNIEYYGRDLCFQDVFKPKQSCVHAIKGYGSVEVKLHYLLTVTPIACEWPAPRSDSFTCRERAPRIYSVGC